MQPTKQVVLPKKKEATRPYADCVYYNQRVVIAVPPDDLSEYIRVISCSRYKNQETLLITYTSMNHVFLMRLERNEQNKGLNNSCDHRKAQCS